MAVFSIQDQFRLSEIPMPSLGQRILVGSISIRYAGFIADWAADRRCRASCSVERGQWRVPRTATNVSRKASLGIVTNVSSALRVADDSLRRST